MITNTFVFHYRRTVFTFHLRSYWVHVFQNIIISLVNQVSIPPSPNGYIHICNIFSLYYFLFYFEACVASDKIFCSLCIFATLYLLRIGVLALIFFVCVANCVDALFLFVFLLCYVFLFHESQVSFAAVHLFGSMFNVSSTSWFGSRVVLYFFDVLYLLCLLHILGHVFFKCSPPPHSFRSESRLGGWMRGRIPIVINSTWFHLVAQLSLPFLLKSQSATCTNISRPYHTNEFARYGSSG